MFIPCNIPSSYADRLFKLNIKLLDCRRAEFDLIFMFKIFHNLLDINFHDYFVLYDSGYNLRRHSMNIRNKTSAKHNQFLNFYFNRICPMWNSLPENIVTASSLTIFKNRLKNFDLNTCLSFIF